MSLPEEVARFLPRLDRVPPAELVNVLETFLKSQVGASEVQVLLVSYDFRLMRLVKAGNDTEEGTVTPAVGDTPVALAFRRQQVLDTEDRVGHIVCLPMSVRGERIGVLSLRLASPPTPTVVHILGAVALATAHMVRASGNYTDVFERARRSRPFTLSAEMQWDRLPARGYECAELSLAGQLLPTYQVGGDHFDYWVERDRLVVTVTDAMGHGLDASMVTALVVGALRHARRRGEPITEHLAGADRMLFERFSGEKFATALITEIDLDSGEATVTGAGHPGVLCLRGGQVHTFSPEPHFPLGMFGTTTYVGQPFPVQRGDRLLFVSDGTLEAVNARGEQFGDGRLSEVLSATAHEDVHAAVAALQESLLDHQPELRDDATLVCLDWFGRR